MNNSQFLQVLKESFKTYLETNPRSNKKLKILHGEIAKDFAERLGAGYKISALGYKKGKEASIDGRYIDKAVDITISQENTPIAGIAVKYVMSNYKQNSNNYFENMLGETANIRSAKIPYFQIFIVPDTLPYFKKDGNIKKAWEKIEEKSLKKYIKLSKDDASVYMHTPNKTLVFLIHISGDTEKIHNKKEYKNYYLKNSFDVRKSSIEANFGSNVIYNDYETFAEKVTYAIKSI